MKNALIIGGSSGLWFILAENLKNDHAVMVTGRKDPDVEGIQFHWLDMVSYEQSLRDIALLIQAVPNIDLLILNAGFYQEWTLSTLTKEQIEQMYVVGLLGPTSIVHTLLAKQKTLENLLVVTSTSQWTPRKLEPVYTASKAWLGMLAQSLSLSDEVGKVLVAGPAGMNTGFWQNTDKDTSSMLDPKRVAEQILEHYSESYAYKMIKIFRDPPRVEVDQIRI